MLSHASLFPLSLLDKTKCIYNDSSKQNKPTTPKPHLQLDFWITENSKGKNQKHKPPPMTYCQLCNNLMVTKKAGPQDTGYLHNLV